MQIRSHAQKYFLKVQKNGTVAHVPPPRPKRKAIHPYPQKAPTNGLSLLVKIKIYFWCWIQFNCWHSDMQFLVTINSFSAIASVCGISFFIAFPCACIFSMGWDFHAYKHCNKWNRSTPRWIQSSHGWRHALVLMCFLLDNYVDFLLFIERELSALIIVCNVTDSADIGSKGLAKISNSDVCGIGRSSRTLPSSELQKQRKQGSALHGKFLTISSFFLKWDPSLLSFNLWVIWFIIVAYEHKREFFSGSSDCSFYFVPPNYPKQAQRNCAPCSPTFFPIELPCHPQNCLIEEGSIQEISKWEPVIINMDDGFLFWHLGL